MGEREEACCGCDVCVLFGFYLCALQVLMLGTSLLSEQWNRSLFQAHLAHAGRGGLPGRAGNKKEINNDRSHPVLCHYAIFSTMPLLPSCIFCAGHQRAAANADVHSAIQLCTLFVGGVWQGREVGRDDTWQVSTKYQLTSLFFIRLKSRQKNSRKSKQIWTTMLREKLLFLRIEHFSDKDSE